MRDRIFGHIPGEPVGKTYPKREDVAAAGVHRPLEAGICGGQDEGAESIVVSGGYVDDQDFGNVIIYTGHGERDKRGRQSADQQLVKGNLALARSCLDGLPVRVVRGHDPNSVYSPPSGYRYDGLFRVDEYWRTKGREGFQIWRFRLVALSDGELNPPEDSQNPGEPPPPDRVESTVQRIVRSNKIAEAIKRLHDHTCQFCGIRLATPAGPYAEAAHIKALGVPHNGPDVPDNLLCLCANDHVLFDKGAIYIDPDQYVRWTADDSALGQLRARRGHAPSAAYIAYHREHFARRV